MHKKCKKSLAVCLCILIICTFFQSLIILSPVTVRADSDNLKITRIHQKHKELLEGLNSLRKNNIEENSIPLGIAKQVNNDISRYNEDVKKYIEQFNDKMEGFFVSEVQKAAARAELVDKIDLLIRDLKDCNEKVRKINDISGFTIFEIIYKTLALESSSDSNNPYKDNSFRKESPSFLESWFGSNEKTIADYPTKAGINIVKTVKEKYEKKLNEGISLTYEDLDSLEKAKIQNINVIIDESDTNKGELIKLKGRLLNNSQEKIDNLNSYIFSGEQFINTGSKNLRIEAEDIESLYEGVEKLFDCYYDFSLDYNNMRYPDYKNEYCNKVEINNGMVALPEVRRNINNVQIPYVVPKDLDTTKQENIRFLNAMSIDPNTYEIKKSQIRMGGYFPLDYIKIQLDGYVEKINKFKLKHTGRDDENGKIINIDSFDEIIINESKISKAIDKANGENANFIILDREALLAEYSSLKRAEPVKVDFIIDVEYVNGSTKEHKKTITLLPAYDEGWDIAGEDRMFIKNTQLECEEGPQQNIKEDSFIGLSELIDGKPLKGGYLAAIEQDYNNSKTKMIRLAGKIMSEPEESMTLTGKKYEFNMCFSESGVGPPYLRVSMSYKNSENNNPIIEYPKVEIGGKEYELMFYSGSSKEDLNKDAKKYMEDLRSGNEKIGSYSNFNEKDKDAKIINKVFEKFNIEIPDNVYGLSGYKGLDFKDYGKFIFSDSSDEEKDLYAHAYRLFLTSMKNGEYMTIEEQNEYTLKGIFNLYDVGVNDMSSNVINASRIKSEVHKLNDSDLKYYDDTRYRSLAGACAPMQVKKLKMKGSAASSKYFVPNTGDILWLDVPNDIKSDNVGVEKPYILLFKDYVPDKAAIYAGYGYEWERTSNKYTVWHYLLTSDSYLSDINKLDSLNDCSIRKLENGLVSVMMSDKLFWQLISSTTRTRLSFSGYSKIKMGHDNSTYIPLKENPHYYKMDTLNPDWHGFGTNSYGTGKDITREGVYFINTDETSYVLDAALYNPYRERKTVSFLLSNSPLKDCKLKLYRDDREVAVSTSTKDGERIDKFLLEREGKYFLKITGENNKLKSDDPSSSVNSLLHVMYDNREVFVDDGKPIKATWLQNNEKDKYFKKDGIVKSVLYFEKEEADILAKLRNKETLRRFRDKCEIALRFAVPPYERGYKITKEALTDLGVRNASDHPFCGLWLEDLLLVLPDKVNLLLTLNQDETRLLEKLSSKETLDNFKGKCSIVQHDIYPYVPRYRITEEALRYLGFSQDHPYKNKLLNELPDLSDYFKNIRSRLNYNRNGVKVIRYADKTKGKEVIIWEPWDTKIPKEYSAADNYYCIMDETGYSGDIVGEWNFISLKLQEYVQEDSCDMDEIWKTIEDLKELWRFPLLENHDSAHPPLGLDNYFGCRRDDGARKHAGMDLHGYPGQKVVSMYHGKILDVKRNVYYGVDFITVLHPVSDTEKYIVRYGEIKLDPSLKVGDDVHKGQFLGTMEKMYFNSGPMQMLHIEVYKDGNRSDLAVDPIVPNKKKTPEGGYKYLDDEMKFWPFGVRNDLINPKFILDLRMN